MRGTVSHGKSTAVILDVLADLLSSNEHQSICRETCVPIMRRFNLFNLLPRLLDELVANVPLNTGFEAMTGDPKEICPAMKSPDRFLRFVGLKNSGLAEILPWEEQGILRSECQCRMPIKDGGEEKEQGALTFSCRVTNKSKGMPVKHCVYSHMLQTNVSALQHNR